MAYHQSHKSEIAAKNSYAYRKLLSLIQEETEEEKTLARAVQLKLMSQWTKWCSLVRMLSFGNQF